MKEGFNWNLQIYLKIRDQYFTEYETKFYMEHVTSRMLLSIALTFYVRMSCLLQSADLPQYVLESTHRTDLHEAWINAVLLQRRGC